MIPSFTKRITNVKIGYSNRKCEMFQSLMLFGCFSNIIYLRFQIISNPKRWIPFLKRGNNSIWVYSRVIGNCYTMTRVSGILIPTLRILEKYDKVI